jgi:tetratricopeptide (TPR) repeat protein
MLYDSQVGSLPDTAPASRNISLFATAICAALATALLWLPVLRAGFVWDDQDNFLFNPDFGDPSWARLRWAFTTFHLGHYQPLSWLSLQLDHRLWGMNPAGYHATNLVLHAANAGLLVLVLGRLLRMALPEAAADRAALRAACLFGALLFSLHPMRAESVAWITERRDVLCGFFILLATLGYLSADHGNPVRRWILALPFYLAGLLAKAFTVVLPGVWLILDGYPLHRLGSGRRLQAVLEKTLFGLAALPIAWLAIRAQQHSGAMADWAGRPFAQRAAQTAWSVFFYPLKLLWPFHLAPLVELEKDLHPLAPQYLACMAGAAALSLGLALSRRRHPGWTAAWYSYLLFILPVSGLLQSGPQKVALRYSYLACIPFAALLAGGLLRALAAQGLPAQRRRMILLGATLALLGCSLLALRQIRIWSDPVALWTEAVRLAPESAYARGNLAASRERAAAMTQAEQWEDGLRDHPDNPATRRKLALLLADYGEDERALLQLDRLLAADPEDAELRAARARAHARRGDVTALRLALADYSRLLAAPQPAAALLAERAGVRRRLGDLDGALQDYSRAVAAPSQEWPVLANYGAALLAAGRRAEGLAMLQRAEALAPERSRPRIRLLAETTMPENKP